MRLAALLSIVALAFAPLAAAQERAPAERQVLLDLAYTLGEAHALRQACEGEGDQYWRDRMARLIEVEAADEGFNGQLQSRFNAGYNNRTAEFPSCTPESKKALVGTAAKGQGLAGRLAAITHTVHPKPQDDPAAQSADAPPAQADTPR
jgi:uncharacterized protein (TIGR02301 family)